VSETRDTQGNERLEPTIVPVRRPATPSEPFATTRERPRSRAMISVIAVLLSVAGIVTVFVWLPDWVDRPASEAEAEAEAVVDIVEEPEPEEPRMSPEERTALTAQAEALLSQLLEQQQALAERSAASWGDVTWSAYETAARLADEAFLDDDLRLAVSRYQTALSTGQELLDRSESIMADALAAGEAALASGNAELAQSQFSLVLGVEPDNSRAARGLERAETLPAVLEAMADAEALVAEGRLGQAAEAYREVLRIDSDWTAARRALDTVNQRIDNARFDAFITDGFAALENGRNSRALELFSDALAMRPDSEVARDGLSQAEQGLLLDAIAMAEVRGKAFETRELWDQAIERYQEALETDPNLRFAIDGIARAQYRSDLDAKLQALIDTPRLLLSQGVMEDAVALVEEARALESPGPRVSGQIERLDELIELASTPITVTLISDAQTSVTIYRIGELGEFLNMDVELQPGNYTAVGQRRGFRDVRESFTVLPGAANGPVTVICTEAI
jgi:tetratricopeptide (TPR) repeat protein